MREFKTDIIIFLGLIILCSVVLLLTARQSTIDIHDTYFVVDKLSITVLIIGPLTFLIFLGRALTKKFKAKGSNIGLIIGLILVAVITFYFVQLQQSSLSEIMRLDDEGLPDRERFIADAKNRINRTWGLFTFWAVGILLLTIRTIQIWKEEKGS